MSNIKGFPPSSGHATLSDAELEAHIDSCGVLMREAASNYENTSRFADRCAADFWRMAMERAIAMRRPTQVANMEEFLGGAL